ncbi:MAG: hypothetical protein IKW05_03035 [Muribaculaceae bacterium]|nr:hypothetical protein [Muribaculaceae bacterium]
MKRVLFTVISLLVFISTIFSQSEMFEWQTYSAFDNPQQVVEGDEYIYILSDGYLYSYDKKYAELAEMNRDNYLYDSEISLIKYDTEKDMLVVAYKNSNIDIIYKNNTYNIPYIKEEIMNISKTINNINFAPSRDEIYVSTDFGIVIINSKKFEIKTTFKLSEKVVDATFFDDKYFMVDGEKNLNFCLVENNPYEINSWETLKNFTSQPTNIMALPDALWLHTTGDIWAYDKSKVRYLSAGKYISMGLNEAGEVYAFAKTNSRIDLFLQDFKKKETISLLKNIGYTPVSLSNNNKKLLYWLLNENGIASYEMSAENIVKNDTLPIVDKMAVSVPYSLAISGGTLYCVPVGICMDNEDQNSPYNNISYLKDYKWHNILGDNVPSPKDKPSFVKKFILPSKLAIDPQNDEVAYVGTWYDGLYKFENGEYKENWNYMNSPIVGASDNWANMISSLAFDANRNLWMTSYSTEQCVLILKPDGNWVVYDHIEPLIDQKYQCCMIHPTKSKTKWFISQDLTKSYVVAVNINGTLENTADDKYRQFRSFTDQDGKTIDATAYYCIAEDLDGKLWIGTDRGPIVISRPDNFENANFTCQRIKIARNDGTNNADLLLDDETIRAIKVDGANCKWMGTFGNGAYLISADGLETIHHFTTENSMLPSNNIYDIAINQETGEVYFATDKGLASYRAEAAEAEENYENIYAFPNPVRPEFTGDITITGLMFNSLVKITDTVGNLMYQAYSKGGQVVWNGNAPNGERVKSGVYYVWASSSDGKEGVVSKIVFISGKN